MRLHKRRIVEDKRDYIKRIITALVHKKMEGEPDAQKKVGEVYRNYRDGIYKSQTHFSLRPPPKEEVKEDKVDN